MLTVALNHRLNLFSTFASDLQALPWGNSAAEPVVTGSGVLVASGSVFRGKNIRSGSGSLFCILNLILLYFLCYYIDCLSLF